VKRFALLIEASEVPGETKLPGAKADVEGYHSWLYSLSGGDWRDDEIVCLHTPRVSEVKHALAVAGKVDYAFMAFSGHGYHAKELDLTKVCLRGGRLSVRDMIPDTNRATVVIDACRNVMPEIFTESFELSLNQRMKFAKAIVRRNYRKDFEMQVAAAEKGYTFLYSCDLDESAGESARGGYFSRFLLEAGAEFAVHNSDGSKWYPMDSAFSAAAAATTARNRTQRPQFEPGRRRQHFPFGV
jgi:hypothetical protein